MKIDTVKDRIIKIYQKSLKKRLIIIILDYQIKTIKANFLFLKLILILTQSLKEMILLTK